MMGKNKSLIKYAGQILLILVLEIIILLFRIAVPIGSNIDGLSQAYRNIVGESIYFILQLVLIIIVVNHCIFKKSYRAMGLVYGNKNFFALAGNLFYIGIITISTVLLTQIAGDAHLYTITEMMISVILVFVSKAFVQEVIYRGCIMKDFNKIFHNVILAVVCSSLLFATIRLALGIIDSGFQTSYMSELGFKFISSFLIGVYLGSIYYLTNNIWICIIIHGTYEAISVVGYEILIPVFQVIYVICAIAYLIYEVVAHRKLSLEDENDGTNETEFDTIDKSMTVQIEEYIDDNIVGVDSNIGQTNDSEFVRLDNPEDLAKTAMIKCNIEEYKYAHEEDEERYNKDKKEYKSQEVEEISINTSEEIDFNKTSIINIEDINIAVKENKRNQYINHLKSSLGKVIGSYTDIITSDYDISVIAFEGEKFNALVTDGIRLTAMNVPEYLENNAYSEMVIFVSKEFDISQEGIKKEETSWMIDVLDDTIRQLQTGEKYLGWGHIFKNKNSVEPYSAKMGLCGVFIYPPVIQEDMTFYTFKEENRTTYIYNAMPVYKEELDFIAQTSGDVYFTKLKESNISQIVCKDRSNICKDTSLM